MGIMNQRSIEAVLFSAGKPLSIEEIKEATGLNGWEVRKALTELMDYYNEERKKETSLEIIQAGNKYTMQVKAAYKTRGEKVSTPDIDIEHLKTLSLIAFHQPIKQSELRKLIGDRVYTHVDDLIDMKLISSKPYHSTELLTTSRHFPEYFGIKSVDPEDIKTYLAEKLKKNTTD